MKDIKDFEGKYAITEDGRVWSYPKEWKPKGFRGIVKRKGQWVKGVPDKKGYLRVMFRKSRHRKYLGVHRLVAIAFIRNPKNLPQINHINGIKNDNRVENLEWCTPKENTQHAHRNGLMHPPKGEKHWTYKRRLQKTLFSI